MNVLITLDKATSNPRYSLDSVPENKKLEIEYLKRQKASIEKVDQLIEEAEYSLRQLRQEFFNKSTSPVADKTEDSKNSLAFKKSLKESSPPRVGREVLQVSSKDLISFKGLEDNITQSDPECEVAVVEMGTLSPTETNPTTSAASSSSKNKDIKTLTSLSKKLRSFPSKNNQLLSKNETLCKSIDNSGVSTNKNAKPTKVAQNDTNASEVRHIERDTDSSAKDITSNGPIVAVESVGNVKYIPMSKRLLEAKNSVFLKVPSGAVILPEESADVIFPAEAGPDKFVGILTKVDVIKSDPIKTIEAISDLENPCNMLPSILHKEDDPKIEKDIKNKSTSRNTSGDISPNRKSPTSSSTSPNRIKKSATSDSQAKKAISLPRSIALYTSNNQRQKTPADNSVTRTPSTPRTPKENSLVGTSNPQRKSKENSFAKASPTQKSPKGYSFANTLTPLAKRTCCGHEDLPDYCICPSDAPNITRPKETGERCLLLEEISKLSEESCQCKSEIDQLRGSTSQSPKRPSSLLKPCSSSPTKTARSNKKTTSFCIECQTLSPTLIRSINDFRNMPLPDLHLEDSILDSPVPPPQPEEQLMDTSDVDTDEQPDDESYLNTISERTEVTSETSNPISDEIANNVDTPKKLTVQHLPQINIRPPLTMQKVFEIEIKPTGSVNMQIPHIKNICYEEILHTGSSIMNLKPSLSIPKTSVSFVATTQILDDNRKFFENETIENSNSIDGNNICGMAECSSITCSNHNNARPQQIPEVKSSDMKYPECTEYITCITYDCEERDKNDSMASYSVVEKRLNEKSVSSVLQEFNDDKRPSSDVSLIKRSNTSCKIIKSFTSTILLATSPVDNSTVSGDASKPVSVIISSTPSTVKNEASIDIYDTIPEDKDIEKLCGCSSKVDVQDLNDQHLLIIDESLDQFCYCRTKSAVLQELMPGGSMADLRKSEVHLPQLSPNERISICEQKTENDNKNDIDNEKDIELELLSIGPPEFPKQVIVEDIPCDIRQISDTYIMKDGTALFVEDPEYVAQQDNSKMPKSISEFFQDGTSDLTFSEINIIDVDTNVHAAHHYDLDQLLSKLSDVFPEEELAKNRPSTPTRTDTLVVNTLEDIDRNLKALDGKMEIPSESVIDCDCVCKTQESTKQREPKSQSSSDSPVQSNSTLKSSVKLQKPSTTTPIIKHSQSLNRNGSLIEPTGKSSVSKRTSFIIKDKILPINPLDENEDDVDDIKPIESEESIYVLTHDISTQVSEDFLPTAKGPRVTITEVRANIKQKDTVYAKKKHKVNSKDEQLSPTGSEKCINSNTLNTPRSSMKAEKTTKVVSPVVVQYETKGVQKSLEDWAYIPTVKLHKMPNCNDFDTTSTNDTELETLPSRNTPCGDVAKYLPLNSNTLRNYDYECEEINSSSTTTARKVKVFKSPRFSYASSSSEYMEPMIEESLSEGEIKCKCSVSVGELHVCSFGNNDVRSNAAYLKKHPETIIKREFPGENMHLFRQKTFYENWVAYYATKGSTTSASESTEISTDT